MKAFDILVVGELNVDLILSQVQDFPKMGAEILAREMVLTMGSSSAIFACNASTLGAKVGFVGKIGTDSFGTLIIDALKSKNVKTAHIIRSSDYKTGITVALSYSDDRAMVTYPGAMEYLSGENITEELLNETRHLHASSVFLQPLIKRDLISIFRKAKERGLTTSLDTQWDPSEKWDLNLRELLPYVDVFLPNESEIKALTRTSSVEAALEALKPFARWVAVKMGSKGSIAMVDGRTFSAPAFLNSQVVDAIGAGDSFDAGFIVKYIFGQEPERCLRFGNLAGSINTTGAGGTGAFSSLERVRETAARQFGVSSAEFQ